MKAIVLIAAGVVVATSGCSSFSGPQPTWDARVDKDKVAQIDYMAKYRGAKIYWVNYPTRRPDPSDPAPTMVQPTGT